MKKQNKNEAQTKKQDNVRDDAAIKMDELTADLQRTRADFENYRKRMDAEKESVRRAAEQKTINELLPVIDTIERAIGQAPEHLREDAWAQGVVGVEKNLFSTLGKIGIEKMEIIAGETPFDPALHHAVQIDDSTGETEVVAEELRAGYLFQGRVLREAMVRVTHK